MFLAQLFCPAPLPDDALSFYFSGQCLMAILPGMISETDADTMPPKLRAAVFPQTLWTVVLRAKDKSEPALNTLLGSYRRPLLVYLQCKGYALQTSEDDVHDFFAHLLNNDFLRNVGREKGKFRTFLLTSFDRFLIDKRDKEKGLKTRRRPQTGVLERNRFGRPACA